MIHKMSHWLGKLRHCLDLQVENDNSYSRSQEGPARGLTLLQTPQQTEEGRQRRPATRKATLIFSISGCVALVFPQHVQADPTHTSMRLWFTVTCATLTPPRLSSVLESHHQAHGAAHGHLPCVWSEKEWLFFLFLIVINGPCQEKFIIPRKKGRWVREGEHSQKG